MDKGKDQVQYFLEYGFSGPAIANMIGVSLRTVRRRIESFGLAIRNLHLKLTDSELDNEVKAICVLFPDIGYKSLLGEHQRRQIRISRTKGLESLRPRTFLAVVY